MECYGRFYGRRVECSECKLRRRCRTAGDPPLLNAKGTPDFLMDKVLSLHSSRNSFASAERDRRYSRADLLEVVAFMVSMDRRTLDILALKLQRPDLRFNDIAKLKGISRQAVHKMVKKRILAELPELAPLVDSWQAHKKHNRELAEAN